MRRKYKGSAKTEKSLFVGIRNFADKMNIRQCVADVKVAFSLPGNDDWQPRGASGFEKIAEALIVA